MAIIELKYSNIHGGLTSSGRPAGYILISEQDASSQLVFDVKLQENTALLFVGCDPANLKGRHLYYGYGTDPYCNITDSAGRDIPAMGPIRL